MSWTEPYSRDSHILFLVYTTLPYHSCWYTVRQHVTKEQMRTALVVLLVPFSLFSHLAHGLAQPRSSSPFQSLPF